MDDEYSSFEESFVPDDAQADAAAREHAAQQGEPADMGSSQSDMPPPPPEESREQPGGFEERPRRGNGEGKEKKPRGIQDYRNGGFFIRSKVVEQETGELFWIVSPENPEERDQQFKVKALSDPSADKTGLARSMDAWMNDVVEVSLVRRQGAEHWEVWKVAPPPSHKDRLISRPHTLENGEKKVLPALEWSEALDTQVDLYHQYRNFTQTAISAREILTDGPKNREVKDEFVTVMTNEVSRVLGPRAPFSPDEIQSFIDSQFDISCACNKDDVSSMLTGREEGKEGLRRVFYNTEVAFEKQFELGSIDLGVPSERAVALSALANYCAQKAIAHKVVESTCMPVVEDGTGKVMSAHELSERELVKDRVLFAENPLLTSRGREREEREMSEMNAARLVRSLMAASGAKASLPQHDDVRRDEFKVDPTGKKEFATFAGELFEAATPGMPTPEEQAQSPADAVRKAQHAILNASTQTCGERAKEITDGIIWTQREGGALKPPFSLEGPDRSDERIKKFNAGFETVASKTTKAAAGAASLVDKIGEPVIEIF